MSSILFSNATKKYDENGHGVFDLNIDIHAGEFVFLTGASGAGKTTVIRLILRDLALNEGTLFVNGHDLTAMRRSQIPAYRRTLGVVFQDYNLIPTKTVGENIKLAFDIIGADKEEAEQGVVDALRGVGMDSRINDFPNELSGGEQQRVAIARAIANDPAIILADEPTGNLDHETSTNILEIFQKLNKVGKTVVVATHDMSLIANTGKRVIRLNEGRVG